MCNLFLKRVGEEEEEEEENAEKKKKLLTNFFFFLVTVTLLSEITVIHGQVVYLIQQVEHLAFFSWLKFSLI